jgi:SPW repeat-containing protein
VLSPFVFNLTADSRPMWNGLVVGLLVMALGIWSGTATVVRHRPLSAKTSAVACAPAGRSAAQPSAGVHSAWADCPCSGSTRAGQGEVSYALPGSKAFQNRRRNNEAKCESQLTRMPRPRS